MIRKLGSSIAAILFCMAVSVAGWGPAAPPFPLKAVEVLGGTSEPVGEATAEVTPEATEVVELPEFGEPQPFNEEWREITEEDLELLADDPTIIDYVDAYYVNPSGLPPCDMEALREVNETAILTDTGPTEEEMNAEATCYIPSFRLKPRVDGLILGGPSEGTLPDAEIGEDQEDEEQGRAPNTDLDEGLNNLLRCWVNQHWCTDTTGLTGIHWKSSVFPPTLSSGTLAQTMVYFRAHIGGATQNSQITCPSSGYAGGQTFSKNMALGMAWGAFSSSQLPQFRIAWEKFFWADCLGTVTSWVPSTGGTHLLRIVKVSSGTYDWSGDYWVAGVGWANIFLTTTSGVQQAQFIDWGMEVSTILANVNGVHIPWNIMEKAQISGHELPQYTPWHDQSFSTYWYGRSEHYQWSPEFTIHNWNPYDHISFGSIQASLN